MQRNKKLTKCRYVIERHWHGTLYFQLKTFKLLRLEKYEGQFFAKSNPISLLINSQQTILHMTTYTALRIKSGNNLKNGKFWHENDRFLISMSQFSKN